MEPDLVKLLARQEIEDLVIRMFVAADERDWETLKTCFTSPFVLDMTSMAGGARMSLTPEQVADAWAEAFERLDDVHHQIGNFQTIVTGATATLQCYGGAFHHRRNIASEAKTRQYVGTYKLKCVRQDGRWLISEHMFVWKFTEGNPDLEAATLT